MKHIAIIHAGAIGDLVQALPTFRAIRAKWPEARITLIGRPARTVLARMAGLCDQCVDLETSGLWHLMSDEGADAPVPPCLRGTDLVVDFLLKPRKPAVAARSAQPEFVFIDGLPPADWQETAASWVFREARRQLDLPGVPLVPEIPVPDEAIRSAGRLLAEKRCREPFFAIHPGSGSPRKNWPMERFAELAGRLRCESGRPILWLLGPAEIDRGVAAPAGPQDAVLAELPLDRVAGILALAGLYVGNDSGVTQVAAAVRRPDASATPTVALFGPTDPRVWAPQGPHVRVVRAPSPDMADLGVGAVWESVAGIIR